jgi:L-ascorbate metabolism protein UlaG (beta-lactamase superfamily)
MVLGSRLQTAPTETKISDLNDDDKGEAMVKRIFLTVLTLFIAVAATAQDQLPTDTIKTAKADFRITFLGHASLLFTFKGKHIYVDPVGFWADYTKLPKADVILVSHNETDHLDTKAISTLQTSDTVVVLSQSCENAVAGGVEMYNGDVQTIKGIKVEAVPAYSIVHKRGFGEPYHRRGEGNGYVLAFDDKRVYVASDTELTPEMKSLKNIDVAFLPLNLPYNMTPKMAADAVKAFKPKIVYPYQYERQDPQNLVDLLQNTKGVQVRIRNMYGISGSAWGPGWNREGITLPSSSY